MKETTTDFGTLVRELREIRGWTQAELSEQIGVRTSAVSSWETGVHEPRLSSVLSVARAFDVAPHKLVEEIE